MRCKMFVGIKKYLLLIIIIGINAVTSVQCENIITHGTQLNKELIVDRSEYIKNVKKTILNKLQEILNGLIKDQRSNKQDDDIVYNDFTTFSYHIYQYVKHLIDDRVITYPKDIEHIWEQILKKNSKIIQDNKINFYKINSINEIMNYYVSVKMQLIRQNINYLTQSIQLKSPKTLYSALLSTFIRRYSDVLDIFNVAPEIFLPKDSEKVIQYTKYQFNFQKSEMKQNITGIILNIISDNDENELEELNEYEVPLFIEKVQSIIDKSDELNIYEIIEKVREERKEFKTNLDYILYYIRNNNVFAKQCIGTYIKKECIDKMFNNKLHSRDKDIAKNNLKIVLEKIKKREIFQQFYEDIEAEIKKAEEEYKKTLQLEQDEIDFGNINNINIANHFQRIPTNNKKYQKFKRKGTKTVSTKDFKNQYTN